MTVCACIAVATPALLPLGLPADNSHMSLACLRAATGWLTFTGQHRGQSTLELLAAHSPAVHPVDVATGDAHMWLVLRLRQKKIIYWTNLSTPAALAHLARYLEQVYNSPATSRTTTSGNRVVNRIHCLTCKSGWIVGDEFHHILLLSNNTDLTWASDGLAELQKIPGFVRGRIKGNTERFANVSLLHLHTSKFPHCLPI